MCQERERVIKYAIKRRRSSEELKKSSYISEVRQKLNIMAARGGEETKGGRCTGEE